MGWLLLGLGLFFSVHVLSSLPWATRLKTQFGDNLYKGVYSLISLVGLILAGVGKAQAEFVQVWSALPALTPLVYASMWLCFVLLPAAHMPGNVKRFIAHPMLAGILLWSVSHLLVNGDLASILLFGSFALYAIYAMWSQSSRGARRQTYVVPLKKDLIIVAAGTTVFVAVWLLHGLLFGVSVTKVALF